MLVLYASLLQPYTLPYDGYLPNTSVIINCNLYSKSAKQVAKFAWYHTIFYLMFAPDLMLAMPKCQLSGRQKGVMLEM
jgi:hypothetical protein